MLGDDVNLERIIESHPIDLNKVIDQNGHTLLTLAASYGLSKCIEVLLRQEEIDLNKPQVKKKVPDFAIGRERFYESKGLLEKLSLLEKTPLGIAVMKGFIDVARVLLQDPRLNPNITTHRGCPPLSISMEREDELMFDLLLGDKRIDPNYPFEEGVPPLCFAAKRQDVIFMQKLLDHPLINPNQQNRYDQTPLYISVIHATTGGGSIESIRILLDHNFTDPNLRSQYGQPPLYLASSFGRTDIVDLFLSYERVNPNVSHQFGAHLTSLLLGIQNGQPEAVELLAGDEQTELFPPEANQETSPFLKAIQSTSEEIKRVSSAVYPVSGDEDASLVEWTRVAFLPVSNDPKHRPPAEYLDDVEVVSSNCIRNKKFGELEVVPVREKNRKRAAFLRVVYRTADYVTISVLHCNQPFGPTLYRPLSSIDRTSMRVAQEVQDIWHIANRAISPDSPVIHAMLTMLAGRNIMVFRALNADHDQKLLIQGKPLKGRGSSSCVKDQVQGKPTSLLSASTRPISKFVGDSRVKSGGYAAIFTKAGAALFLGSNTPYPSVLSHEETLDKVSDDSRLVKRVRDAKEMLFTSPVPSEIIALLDDGYPSLRASSIRERISYSIPRSIQKILDKDSIVFDSLPIELKELLCSGKSLKTKKRGLEDFLADKR